MVRRHSHPQEQITIVLEGLLEFKVSGRRFTAIAGDVVHVPPGVEHLAAAVTDAVVVDASCRLETIGGGAPSAGIVYIHPSSTLHGR